MRIIENLKIIFETITAFSTAMIVIIGFFKLMPKSMKKFFFKTIPLFLKGTIDSKGKSVRFLKAIKAEKENHERLKNLISIVAPDCKSDEYLILNKEEILNLLESSKLFIHVSCRKNAE